MSQEVHTKPVTVSILTWNVFMLPSWSFKFTGQEERAKAIGEIIGANPRWDIIVFQEVFHNGAFNKLKEILTPYYPHQIGPANKKVGLKTHSGVWVISKYPIENVESIAYRGLSGIDFFARKGAIYSKHLIQGQEFHMVSTHMQSGTGKNKEAARKRELSRIKELFDKLGVSNAPQFIVGDLNVVEGSDEYKGMLTILEAKNIYLPKDQPFTCSTPEYGTLDERLDYILFRSNGKEVKGEASIPYLQKEWKKGWMMLSDHFPVQTVFHIH